MNVKTYLKTEADKEGRQQILFFVTHQGKRIKIPTGIKVHPASWTGSGVKTSRKEPQKQAEAKDSLLKIKHGIINKIIADSMINMENLTLERLKERFLNWNMKKDLEDQVPESDTKLLFRNIVDSYKEKYRNIRKESTMRKFNQVVTALEQYNKNILITEIDHDFLIEYCNFLIEEGKENNTIKHNHIKIIKIIAKEALRQGIRVSRDIEQFTWKGAKKKPFAATWDEVQEIAKLEGLNKSQQHIRDGFIISCYTGLRNSDLKNIRKSMINEQDGKKVLRVVMEKTGFDYYIPLNDTVISILEKYGYDMPVYTLQHENREIKDIAWKVTKEEKVPRIRFMGNRKTVDMVLKKEMFSTHTGRRTFGRRFLDKGGSVVILSKMLGHNSIETTLRYIGYEPQEVMDEYFRVMGDD
jgi:integrase